MIELYWLWQKLKEPPTVERASQYALMRINEENAKLSEACGGGTMTRLERAADALRRHEQYGKKLNDWDKISRAQQRKWEAKAQVVLHAYHVEPLK